MLQLQAFRGLRYDFAKLGGDLSAVLAPPYDVLDSRDKDALLTASEHNIVAVDLPHLPPKTAGPAEAYQQAAVLLRDWKASGVLVEEPKPALYVYHQTFKHAGERRTRRKFFARLRLAEFSEGVILPHEKTFGGPKEDRLALMKATEYQLSPIFGLFTDPAGDVLSSLDAATQRDGDARGTVDGVESSTWIVDDSEVIDSVAGQMQDKKVYIADGHHRYGTALLYREWARAEAGGSLPDDHPANFIMFVLASMDDPGCVILPYHRAIGGTGVAELLSAWDGAVEEIEGGDADLTLVSADGSTRADLRFSNRGALRDLEPNQCDAWYDLDYAYLHRYLIDELLAKKTGASPKLHYVKSEAAAMEAAAESSGVALLTRATPMEHLRAVSEQGGLMPQKSTYFAPKLATGVVMNPLT